MNRYFAHCVTLVALSSLAGAQPNDSAAGNTATSAARQRLAATKASLVAANASNLTAAGRAYRDAWKAALKFRKSASDSAAQDLIQDEWINALRDNETAAKWQLYALADEWDRSLLIGDFWRLFFETRNPKTLSAACFTLYAGGMATDIAMAKERRRQTTSAELQAILDHTIAWMEYKHLGVGRGSAPPSVACPAPEE